MTEFETETENAALKQRIIDRIGQDRGISFRDFMAMALYEPGLGYYMTERSILGREGDYLTSPETTPVFGAMVGRQLREMWQMLGAPARFDVIEAGAGSGALARNILAWVKRTDISLFDSIRYAIVEISPPLMARQRSQIEAAGLAERVRWLDIVPTGVTGVILSNELLDAMPVHRVTAQNGRLREVFVTWDSEHFGEELRDSALEIAEHFERLAVGPGEGCRAEVNLGALDWIRDAAAALDRGFLMTMDYGYEAEELYAPWRTGGTLLCFYRHNPGNDPYVRIGRQDMTAHVDLTSIRRAGEAAGLTTLGCVKQSQFLSNLGIGEAMQAPEGGHLEEYFARRRAVTELLDPGGLGRISVLIQERDVVGAQLTALREDD